MNKFDLNNIVSQAKQVFPKDAADISDALDLLHLALDGLGTHVNAQISELLKNKDFDRSSELLSLSKAVSNLQDKISEYAAALIVETEADEDDDAPEEDIVEEQKTIPDYVMYTVDSSVPHSLYEDFTHKKTTGFSIGGEHYQAKDWKDVLLQTCNFLSKLDADKFDAFLSDPVMKGRKNSYFGKTFVERKNAKLKNLDIYVWTNLSANHIRNLIRKLLKKFDIKISNFYIYLRADYTPLHKDADEDTTSVFASPADKVGKFVRHTMRQLSNKQRAFSKNELTAMQSKQWSKTTLDIDYPLLKAYVEGVDISEQIKEGNYGRYWKEIFEFGGKKFLVTSQWFERNRDGFALWVEKLLVAGV